MRQVSPDGKHLILEGLPTQDYLNCKKNSKGQYQVELNHLNMHLLNLLHTVQSPIRHNLKFPDPRLHAYQVQDIKRMVAQKHVYNANRMGYGKTVEAIKTLQECSVRNALILAPKAVLYQWEKEFDEWWPEHPPIYIRRMPDYKAIRKSIVILNYEQLLAPRVLGCLRSLTWDCIVCDEAHRLKNRKSKRTVAASQLPAVRKIMLSGTPILNKPADLWAQWNWLDWRFSGRSYWEFVEYFLNVEDGYFGKELGHLKPEHIDNLNYLVSLTTIQNPDMKLTLGKHIHTVKLKMEPSQQKLYTDTKKLIWESLPEEMTITNAMTHFLRLRQITSAPEQYNPDITNAKLDWLEQQVEDNPDTKFVVYTNWVCVVEQICSRLGLNATPYTGSMSDSERRFSTKLFSHSDGPQVLVGTIGALGTGVDGLQHVSSTVVFFDQDYSPEINAQAEDRVNRQGQKEPVHVYYLECEGTVDQHVSKINQMKMEDIKECFK